MRKVVFLLCVLPLLCRGATLKAQSDGELSTSEVLKSGLKIKLASVFVDDQDKALTFYTETLGFVKKTDIPVGEYRWLTVVSPADPDGTELLLEPNVNPAAATYQKAIYNQGIPATLLFVADIQAEFARLSALGVRFTQEPTEVGTTTIAVFDDTCGNLIQMALE
ncbi:MAG: VOC family protein [candidate division Zixibacteria bacterium]|nr:VOC family protein [candidate division Zixibacteria bacterium]